MINFRTEVELDKALEFYLKVELMFMEASEEDIRIPLTA